MDLAPYGHSDFIPIVASSTALIVTSISVTIPEFLIASRAVEPWGKSGRLAYCINMHVGKAFDSITVPLL